MSFLISQHNEICYISMICHNKSCTLTTKTLTIK